MISSLASLADRNFVLGFLLPVAIAMLALSGLFQDVPALSNLWNMAVGGGNATELAALLLGVWALAAVLFAVNTALYRLLEGYYGPMAWRNVYLVKAQKAYDALNSLAANETAASAAYESAVAGKAPPADVAAAEAKMHEAERAHAEALRDYHGQYPAPPALTLPTRFGNVIRAGETYPLTVYYADGISVWPRLISVMPETYQKTLDSARAKVDFFVNSCFLALLFTAAALLRAAGAFAVCHAPASWDTWLAAYCIDGGNWGLVAMYLGLAVLGAATYWACYRGAVAQASEWMVYVRSAFDLYLPGLASALGTPLPAALEDRQDYWYRQVQTFIENRPPP